MRATTLTILALLMLATPVLADFAVYGLEDTATIWKTTTNRTGNSVAADSSPVVYCYEQAGDSPLTNGSMAYVDSRYATGFYYYNFTVASASGYEAGKFYSCYINATVDGTTGNAHYDFHVVAAGHSLEEIADNIDDIETDTSTTLDDFIDTEIATLLLNVVSVNTTVKANASTSIGELRTVDGNVDSILTDTGTTIPAQLNTNFSTTLGEIRTVDSNVDSILTDTGTTLPAQLNTNVSTVLTELRVVDTNVDDIETDTNELQGNQANWATATGFCTVANNTLVLSELRTVDSNVDSTLTDTGTTLPAQLNTNTSTVLTELRIVDTNVDDIETDTAAQDTASEWDTLMASIFTRFVSINTTVKANASTLLSEQRTINQSIATTAEVAAVTTVVKANASTLLGEVRNVNDSLALTSDIAGINDSLATFGNMSTLLSEIREVNDSLALTSDISGINDSLPTRAEMQQNFSDIVTHGDGEWTTGGAGSLTYEQVKDAVRKGNLDRFDKRTYYTYDGLNRISTIEHLFTNASSFGSPDYSFTETLNYTSIYTLDTVTYANTTSRW